MASILFLTTLHCAAQAPIKYSASVQLLISCEDVSLNTQFGSFLRRELRSLGDITIVDSKPDYVVNLVALKLTGAGNSISGVSVAVLIVSPQNADFLNVVKDKLEDWRFERLKQMTDGASYILDFKIRSGSLDDVKSVSEKIIADFDATILEPGRKTWSLTHKPLVKPK
jgi:hypothetical protein